MDDLISRKRVLEEIDSPSTVRLTKKIEALPSAFEDMTCGEVIQSIFPSDKCVERTYTSVHYNYMTFLIDFWDSPYKGASDWNSPYKGVSE